MKFNFSEVHVHAKKPKIVKTKMKTATVISQYQQQEKSGVVMKENLQIHKLLASPACTSSNRKISRMIQREELLWVH